MVECVAWDDVVLGSSPRFLNYVESSSDGRTPDCDSGCRGFKSRLSPHMISFGDVKCMPLFKGVFILRDGRPGVIPGRRHIRFYLQNKNASPLMTLTESVDSRRQLWLRLYEIRNTLMKVRNNNMIQCSYPL